MYNVSLVRRLLVLATLCQFASFNEETVQFTVQSVRESICRVPLAGMLLDQVTIGYAICKGIHM